MYVSGKHYCTPGSCSRQGGVFHERKINHTREDDRSGLLRAACQGVRRRISARRMSIASMIATITSGGEGSIGRYFSPPSLPNRITIKVASLETCNRSSKLSAGAVHLLSLAPAGTASSNFCW